MSKESDIRTQVGESQHRVSAIKQWNWAWLQKGTNPWQEPTYMLVVGVSLRPAFFSWSALGYMPWIGRGCEWKISFFHICDLKEFSQSWWSILSPFLTWPLSSLCSVDHFLFLEMSLLLVFYTPHVLSCLLASSAAPPPSPLLFHLPSLLLF